MSRKERVLDESTWDPANLQGDVNLGHIGRILVAPHLAKQKVAAVIDAEFGKGAWKELVEGIPADLAPTWLGILVSTRGTAGLEFLAEGLVKRWKIHDEGLRDALRNRANDDGKTLDEEKMYWVRIGLLLAVSLMNQPQTVRIGRHWVKDPNGKIAMVAPHDLRADVAVNWLADKAMAEATAALRDDLGFLPPSLEKEPVLLEENTYLDTPSGLDSLASMVDQVSAGTKELNALLCAVSPRQREVLEALHSSLDAGATVSEAKAEASEKLNLGPKAIDVTLSRIRTRFPDPLS